MREIPVEIKKNDKINLYGVVHIPDNERLPRNKRVGINIIVPGIKYRVAPNRLSVKIARRLCSDGFYVLRADPEGVGESDGDLGEKRSIKEIFVDIQNGLFVDDTVVFQEYFRKKFYLDDVAMLGNCGGAATALLSCKRAEAENLVLIDLPIVYSSKEIGFKEQALRGAGYSGKILKSYISKMVSLKNWIRFLSFKSEYGVIHNLIKLKLKTVFKKTKKTGQSLNLKNIPELSGSGEKLNARVFETFRDFQAGEGKALFICAELDAGTPLLEDYFFSQFNIKESHKLSDSRKHVIKSGNHIYTDIQSQNELIETVSTWFKETYC